MYEVSGKHSNFQNKSCISGLEAEWLRDRSSKKVFFYLPRKGCLIQFGHI